MGKEPSEADKHLEWEISHFVPSGQQWSLSSQHTAYTGRKITSEDRGHQGQFSADNKVQMLDLNAVRRIHDKETYNLEPDIKLWDWVELASSTSRPCKVFLGVKCSGVVVLGASVLGRGLLYITFTKGQQPQEPSRSWQQVVSSGHSDIWSGQMTAFTLLSWNHRRSQPAHVNDTKTQKHSMAEAASIASVSIFTSRDLLIRGDGKQTNHIKSKNISPTCLVGTRLIHGRETVLLTHLAWTRSQTVPSKQQWRWSEQHSACKETTNKGLLTVLTLKSV